MCISDDIPPFKNLQFSNVFLHCIPIKNTFHSMFLYYFLAPLVVAKSQKYTKLFHSNIETDLDILQILKLSLCLLYLLYVIHSICTYNHQICISNTNPMVLF